MAKRKKFFLDIIKNTFAFGIYIAAFHLLMMPYLAKQLDTGLNARLLLFIMISNILTFTLGNELGVLYQILEGRRPGKENASDLWRMLNQSNLFLVFGTALILWILGFEAVEIVLLSFTSVFGNIRFFLQGYLRQDKKFMAVAIGNLFYLIGVISAMLIFIKTGVIYWLPVCMAELFSVSFLLSYSKIFRYTGLPASAQYRTKMKEFWELAGATILTNIPNYADKVLILPLLGDLTMSVYYAGTVLSKMLFLIVNPINAVVLSWLSSDRTTDENQVIKTQLKANSVILLIVFVISFPLTYVLTRLFYSQFLGSIIGILLPLSLISAFSIAASFLRVVFLRFFDLKMLKFINVFHLLVFLILAPLGAVIYGLAGFTIGVAVSKGVLWFTFLVLIAKKAKVNRFNPSEA